VSVVIYVVSVMATYMSP